LLRVPCKGTSNLSSAPSGLPNQDRLLAVFALGKFPEVAGAESFLPESFAQGFFALAPSVPIQELLWDEVLLERR